MAGVSIKHAFEFMKDKKGHHQTVERTQPV